MNITFRQLSVFVSIARHGSMTAAADALFMTKGAISQTLAELENQLGVRLFDRLHARLFINHEGQKLLPVADELLSRMQGVERLFGDDHEDTRLRVGCTRTIGSYFMPDMFLDFDRKNGWLPQSVIANTQEICGMLNRFEIDIALLEGLPTDSRLVSETWMEDEMVVVAGKNHPLAKEKDVTLEKLSRECWLLREEGSSSRAFFENQLALNFDHPLQTLSLNASDTILSCVYHNLGITFISSRMLKQPLYAGHFVRVQTGKRFLRKFVLCYHPDKFMSPTLEKWMGFCRAWDKDITG